MSKIIVVSDEAPKSKYTHADPSITFRPRHTDVSVFQTSIMNYYKDLLNFKAKLLGYVLEVIKQTKSYAMAQEIFKKVKSNATNSIQIYKSEIQDLLSNAVTEEDRKSAERLLIAYDETLQEILNSVQSEIEKRFDVGGVKSVETSSDIATKAHHYTDIPAQARAAALMQMCEESEGGKEHKRLWQSAAKSFKKEHGKDMQCTIERMYKWKCAPPSIDAIKSTVRKFMIERGVYPYPPLVSLLVHNPFQERGIVPDFTGDTPFEQRMY